MNSLTKQLPNKVKKILDKHNIRNYESVYEQDGEYYVELEWQSDAGEDVIGTIWFDGTTKGFVEGVREAYESFDPDEHAAMWWENRNNVGGVPQSLRTLIDDADGIQKTLEDLAIELARLK